MKQFDQSAVLALPFADVEINLKLVSINKTSA
jgi:hypothetical protein